MVEILIVMVVGVVLIALGSLQKENGKFRDLHFKPKAVRELESFLGYLKIVLILVPVGLKYSKKQM